MVTKFSLSAQNLFNSDYLIHQEVMKPQKKISVIVNLIYEYTGTV